MTQATTKSVAPSLQAEAEVSVVEVLPTEVAVVEAYPTQPISENQRTREAAESGSTFKKALSQFRKAVHNSMTYARLCAELAILHYEQHGDLVYAQAFLDAMPKNFTRRVAFLKWLAAHSPVTMTAGKLSKDKGAKAVKFDTEAALDKPFWDFAPDPEQIMWGETDIVKALNGAIHRFSGDNYTPKSPAAIAKLEQAAAAIAKLA